MSDGDAPQTNLRALSLRDLDSMQFPQIEWAVDELIPAGSLTLMVGRPKAGKSLVAVDLVGSIATGETFLDRSTMQGPAIYIPAEDALPLVRARLWTRIGEERDAPLYVAPVDGSPVEPGGDPQMLRLDDNASLSSLISLVYQVKPTVLVLDPFRELHRRKENDADEMAELLRPLRQLAHDSGAAIILIHHRNKYGADSSTAVRGSSAITGGVDQVMTMELDGDDDSADLSPDRTLKIQVEGRYGPRRRLAAQLRPGLRWLPTRPSIDDLDVPGKVWRHLYLNGSAHTADELVEIVGAAKRSVQNAMTELARKHQVRRLGAGAKGDPYRYASTTAADSAELAIMQNGNLGGRKDESGNGPETSQEFVPHSSQDHEMNGRTPMVFTVCANCGLPRGTGAHCPNCGAANTTYALH